ncbi:unnamed protein product [Cercospora beticola]|nr:unnamed protein product [Cercospora beticola]
MIVREQLRDELASHRLRSLWCQCCLSECDMVVSSRALILRGIVQPPREGPQSSRRCFQRLNTLVQREEYEQYRCKAGIAQISQAMVEGKNLQDVAALKDSAHPSTPSLHGMPEVYYM